MKEHPVDPYLFPARGRKQYTPKGIEFHFKDPLIPTFSPQGDGNHPVDLLLAVI